MQVEKAGIREKKFQVFNYDWWNKNVQIEPCPMNVMLVIALGLCFNLSFYLLTGPPPQGYFSEIMLTHPL